MTGLIEEAVSTAAEVVAPEAAIPAKIGGWLLGDAWRVVAIGALVAVGVQQVRIGGLYLRPHVGPVGLTLIDLPGWRPRALAAEKTLAEVQSDQPIAAAAQAAVNHQTAVISAAIAKASDDDAKVYYDKGRAAGAAYAAAHGVRTACTDGVAGNTAVPGADQPAAQHDGPGDATGMVAVSRADFDQLTANSFRLAKVHQDAESLIAAGVAVPEATPANDKPR